MIAKCKGAFTLIEMLIVVTLLTMASGLIGIKVHQAVRQQRFLTEVDQVAEKLRTAQDLMLIAGAEVRLLFQQRENGIELELVCDDPLPDVWDTLLQRKLMLKAIHGVHFSDAGQGKLELGFLSRGSVMPRGVLRLEGAKKGDAMEKRYIALQGCPAPISVASVEPELLHFDNDDLVQITMEELNEKETPSHPS